MGSQHFVDEGYDQLGEKNKSGILKLYIPVNVSGKKSQPRT